MPSGSDEDDHDDNEEDIQDEDEDEDDELEDESERPTKRAKQNDKIRSDKQDMDEDNNDDEDDDDDDEDEDDEEYKERYKPSPKKKQQPGSETMDTDALPSGEKKASLKSTSNNSKDQYVVLPGYGEHKRAVSSVKFAPARLMKKDKPHAAICASSSADGYIKLWDVQDSSTSSEEALEPTVTCGGHTRGINDICWNPVSPFLASASDDKTVRLWDMVTGDALVEYKGHDSFVFCVDQYQHMIVSGSFDETVKLWDIRSGDCVSTLPAHSDPVTSVSFNRDGTVVCTASHDGLIRLWDVASGECLKTIYAAGNPPVCHAKFSPNSKYILASTLMDATLRLWPVNRMGSNLCAKTYKSEHHVNVKYSIVADFMSDGNIVTGSETGNVIIYNLQTQEVMQVLDHHEDAVLAVSAHQTIPLLASGAMMNDRKVHFWAPQSFEF